MQNIKQTNYTKTLDFKKMAFTVFTSIFLFLLVVFFYNLSIGFHFSSICATVLATALLISGYFYVYKERFLLGTYLLFYTQLIVLTLVIYKEGIMSGHHLYFFTMIFAIPFIVKREKKYDNHIKIFYISTVIAIVLATIISPRYASTFPESSHDLIYGKLILNTVINFLVIIIFSLLALQTGEKFLNSIHKQKLIAEDEKERRTKVLSNIGHELRTQINSINGITQLILEKQGIDKEEREYAEVLDYCNNNMLFLVNDMLDIHKIESGKFELIKKTEDLGQLLSKITSPFKNKAEEKNLQIISDIDVNLDKVHVEIDGSRFNQIIHNLLSNALKFTDKGKVEFKAEIVSSSSNNINVKFSVKDTGRGIAKEDFNKVFESFQQVTNADKPVYGGTGLGLAISKTIVEKMDSKLQLKSKVNKGSEFYFTVKFDVIDAYSAMSKTIDNYKITDKFLSNTTILIVEDNAVSMMYANKVLTKYGAKTYQAKNGLEAISKVNVHNDIDIVLLDLEMPKMNGFKAVTHIKSLQPDIPVIAFTANIPTQDMLESLIALEFDDVVSKPFKNEDLFSVIKTYIK